MEILIVGHALAKVVESPMCGARRGFNGATFVNITNLHRICARQGWSRYQ